ncbi:Synaptogyrin-1 [Anabarilius grahami]|uniref:Synaptogyrin n=1 Tax=Anabarilius grahami TaxID=495550 RepID=A0A3N0Y6K7_ANAGA|nr:Synaptogyrin-1 [Anabarilius grahami]
MQQGAFGAGRAGGAFDPLTFIQQPHTGLRIVSWLFSLVVFGCIANEGYINRPDEVEQFCIFNRNQNACNYAVSMGSLAFLCCMAFLALDAYFPQISSVKDRKKAVLADLKTEVGVCGYIDLIASYLTKKTFWSFIWFVGFCFLANQWQVAKPEDNPLRAGGDAARAAITFSFFSIFTWAAQAFLAFQRYKLGADSALFSQDYADPSLDAADVPYSSYSAGDGLESPGEPGSYQQSGDGGFDGSAGYQRQEY